MTDRVLSDLQGHRVLDVAVHAFSPARSLLLSVRFYYFFRSVDQRLAEMSQDFLSITICTLPGLSRTGSRQIDFDMQLDPDVPRLIGDVDRLRQVVANMLLNAVQALDERASIRILLQNAYRGAEMVVDDDGPGISPDQRETCFDPFFSIQEKGKGAGPGLAICRKLIEEHGGRIQALDSPLGGARIRSYLPCDIEGKTQTRC